MDPNSFDAVRVINSSKIQWRIRVRIIRMWTISNGYGGVPSSYEMIIRDQEASLVVMSAPDFILINH